jgi:hypothetical protein
MMNANDKIRLRVNDFVDVLSTLIRQATVDEITEALKSATAHPSARGAAPVAPVAQRKNARDVRGVAGRKPGYQAKAPVAVSRPGQQRAPELLAQLMGRVQSHIEGNPGHGVGAIAVGLGTSTKELSLVLRKLLDDKKVISKGKKRGTRYFPR